MGCERVEQWDLFFTGACRRTGGVFGEGVDPLTGNLNTHLVNNNIQI